MKTFIYSLLLIAFVLSACEDEVLIGTDTPINPERNEATIGAEGGTISIKTETPFWLLYIYEYEDGVEKQSISNELEGERLRRMKRGRSGLSRWKFKVVMLLTE